MALIEKLSNIADAIRAKTGKTDEMSLEQMVTEIQSISGGDDPELEEVSITNNGTYTPSTGKDGFSKVTAEIYSTPLIYGYNTDNEGWVFPDEYHTTIDGVEYDNNIELIPIDRENNESAVYILYDCRREGSFCRLRIYGSSLKVDMGHCKNGTFTPFTTQQSVTSGGYYTKWLSDIGYDFVVIRVQGDQIWQCYTYAWSATTEHPSALSANANTALMRYGNMPYGTNITFLSLTLESDNIKDFAKMRNNYAITVTGAYSGNIGMQRWRCDGWNIANNTNTSLASVFNGCYLLHDVPNPTDFSGWCTSKTTTLGSFLYNCYSWNKPIICNNWDLSVCTTMASAFNGAKSLPYIYGTETWTGGALCTNWSTAFSTCYNLSNKMLDLSGLTFSSKITTLASMFNATYCLQGIKLPDMDLTNTTTVAAMFASAYSLSTLVHGNIIPPLASKITTTATIFSGCYCLEGTDFLKGWDLTNCIVNGMFSYMYALQDTRQIDLTDTVFPTKKTSYSSNSMPFCNLINAKYIDQSWVDCGVDTSSTKYLTTSMFTSNANCVEFYPPQNIGEYSFSVSPANKLSHDSIVRLLNALPTASSKKLTLGTINLAKLTSEEKAIATSKGWTLA